MTSETWPLFILTLEGDDGRRADLISALDKFGLEYNLFHGVDGRTGLPSRYQNRVDRVRAKRRHRRELTDAELAVSLSHCAIYQQIIDMKLGGAVILEDDAVLTDAFRGFMEKRVYASSDMVMLNHSHARVHGPNISLNPGIDARKLSLASVRATGYSVSTNAARYLLDANTPVTDVADWPGDVTTVGALACVPAIVLHQDPEIGPSHLEAGRHKVASDPFRFFQWMFWKRWITKRLSSRVS